MCLMAGSLPRCCGAVHTEGKSNVPLSPNLDPYQLPSTPGPIGLGEDQGTVTCMSTQHEDCHRGQRCRQRGVSSRLDLEVERETSGWGLD